MDPFDYVFYNAVGNTCNGYGTSVENLSIDDFAITKNATKAAYKQALYKYFLTMIPGKYFDPDTGALCTGCIDQNDLNRLIDFIQGPGGIFEYFEKDYRDVELRFWNSLYPAGHPDKKTGTVTSSSTFTKVYPINQIVTVTITTDYTNAQIPNRALYDEFRQKLGIFLQKLKEYHYLSLKMPFTTVS